MGDALLIAFGGEQMLGPPLLAAGGFAGSVVLLKVRQGGVFTLARGG